MKRRIISGLFAAIMMFSCLVFAGATNINPSASLYLDGYAVGVIPQGNCEMAVSYIVYGTNTMDTLGAQKIKVEEWDGRDWEQTMTFSVSKNPEFYVHDASEHAGVVYFIGLPGVQYRATLTAYAERNGGSDTGTVTSDPTTCK